MLIISTYLFAKNCSFANLTILTTLSLHTKQEYTFNTEAFNIESKWEYKQKQLLSYQIKSA